MDALSHEATAGFSSSRQGYAAARASLLRYEERLRGKRDEAAAEADRFDKLAEETLANSRALAAELVEATARVREVEEDYRKATKALDEAFAECNRNADTIDHLTIRAETAEKNLATAMRGGVFDAD